VPKTLTFSNLYFKGSKEVFNGGSAANGY